jgi:hypothetical protein
MTTLTSDDSARKIKNYGGETPKKKIFNTENAEGHREERFLAAQADRLQEQTGGKSVGLLRSE